MGLGTRFRAPFFYPVLFIHIRGLAVQLRNSPDPLAAHESRDKTDNARISRIDPTITQTCGVDHKPEFASELQILVDRPLPIRIL
jgi:hypothetical protein